MALPKLKLRFVGGWGGFKAENTLIYRILSRHFELDGNSEPDYIIDCGMGWEHAKYERAIKIHWEIENRVPDFNWFDYAIGFDFLEFGDRYLRMPFYAFCEVYHSLPHQIVTAEELKSRDFCSVVISNNQRDQICWQMVERLSRYRKVASGGKCRNNVGGPVKDKQAFIGRYKFNLAFENTDSPGYTTEKVMEPLAAGVVPIYFGNPLVSRDFHEESMVRVTRENLDAAVEEIIRLDRDDAAYLAKVNAPSLVEPDTYAFERKLEKFLLEIISRPKAEAYRRNFHGYQAGERRYLTPILRAYTRLRAVAWFCYQLCRGRKPF